MIQTAAQAIGHLQSLLLLGATNNSREAALSSNDFGVGTLIVFMIVGVSFLILFTSFLFVVLKSKSGAKKDRRNRVPNDP